MDKILITGAEGYIGKCLFYFLKKKFDVIGIDKKKSLEKKIFQCNITNQNKLDLIISKEQPKIIIHLAAQSLVDDTISKKKYYANNVLATNTLLKVMKNHNIKKIIFSSTAAVYNQSSRLLTEKSKVKPLSSYAKTKLVCENNIKKQKKIKSIILRFFNVCSALNKPIIGISNNPITHFIPTVVYKAIYNKKIYIYGNDYSTPDGTCIRDYIHILDICDVIEKSIKHLNANNKSRIFNIGNNRGLSNKEIINYIKKFINPKINISYVHRRNGDASKLVCSLIKVKSLLKWKPKHSNLKKILNDELNWVKKLKRIGLKRTFKNYL